MSSFALPPVSDPTPSVPIGGEPAVEHFHRTAETVSDAVKEFRLKIAYGVPAAAARRAVNRVLHAWDLSYQADDVLLVATELVQNVTKHVVNTCELRLALLQDAILVEVADTDPQPPVLRLHDPRGLGGRGLIIVAAVARRWGYRPVSQGEQPGKVVWAELVLHHAS